LTEIDQQIAHMVTAIKSGFRSETLKKDLEAAEQDRTRLQARLTQDIKRLEKITSFLPNVTGRFKAMVEDFATVTQHQVDKARGILAELVGKQIILHPCADGTDDI
jgi:hypothetical protein